MRRIAKRRALVALGVALVGILIAVAAFAGSARGERDGVPGVKTPAVAANPKWAFIGMEGASPNVSVFGCQTRTIDNPLGACYGPAQIQTAYGVSPLFASDFAGAGRTIVIVDAFQSPTIAHDLALFDRRSTAGPDVEHHRAGRPDAVRPGRREPGRLGGGDLARRPVGPRHRAGGDDRPRPGEVQPRRRHPLRDPVRVEQQPRRRALAELRRGRAVHGPESLVAQHALFDAMVAKSWTRFASSGDQGATLPTCDGASLFQAPSTPASDPDVTGVGGTQLRPTPLVIRAARPRSPTRAASTKARRPGTRARLRGRRWLQGDVQEPGLPGTRRQGHESGGPSDVAYNGAVIGGVIAVWGVSFGPGPRSASAAPAQARRSGPASRP